MKRVMKTRIGLDLVYDRLVEEAMRKLLKIEEELEEEAQRLGVHRHELATMRGSAVLARL